jgi:ABC transporter substrate binding protein
MTLANMRRLGARLVASCLIELVAMSASAASVVRECGDLDSIANLVEPVKDFANKEIRVAHISTLEPAAASHHLLTKQKQAPGESNIPIVMMSTNPVGLGFVASLARPEGNITGLSILGPEVAGKRLELLKLFRMQPRLRPFGTRTIQVRSFH